MNRIVRPLALLLLTAAGALGTACAPAGPVDTSPFEDRPAVRAEVQNDHQHDVRIFAVRYGDYERLGTVTSHTRQSFELPRSWVDAGAGIALRAEPIGAQGHFTTRDYVLEPGSVIELTVRNFLNQSTVRIR